MTPETYEAIVRGYLPADQRASLAHFLIVCEALLGHTGEPAMVLEVLRAQLDEALRPFDLNQDPTGQEAKP